MFHTMDRMMGLRHTPRAHPYRQHYHYYNPPSPWGVETFPHRRSEPEYEYVWTPRRYIPHCFDSEHEEEYESEQETESDSDTSDDNEVQMTPHEEMVDDGERVSSSSALTDEENFTDSLPTVFPRANDVGLAVERIQRAYRRYLDTRNDRHVLQQLKKLHRLTTNLNAILSKEEETLSSIRIDKKIVKRRRYVEGLLTKSLIECDSIETKGNERLRSARRAYVKRVMKTLEDVDKNLSEDSDLHDT